MSRSWENIRVDLKKRAKKAKGDIDDSYLDKKFYCDTDGKVFPCKWCGELMYCHSLDRKKRKMLLSCSNDDCVGNADLSETWRRAKLRKMGYNPDKILGPEKIITKHKIKFNYFDEKGYV
jgi:hypothetical protein